MCSAAWKTASEYQWWTFFFFFISASVFLSPILSGTIFITNSLLVFSSLFVLYCFFSLLSFPAHCWAYFPLLRFYVCFIPPPPCLCDCRCWGLSAAAGLSWAVVCQTTKRKKCLLLMLLPAVCFCDSLPWVIWFLPSSQHLSLLSSISTLIQNFPLGHFLFCSAFFLCFNKCYSAWGSSFSISSVAGRVVVATRHDVGPYLTLILRFRRHEAALDIPMRLQARLLLLCM